MPLPKNVFRTKSGALTYYYHQPRRHLPKAKRGVLTRIPYQPDHPEFWKMAAELNGYSKENAAGTFTSVIAAYKKSPQWASMADGTQKTYTVYLKRIQTAWGASAVDGLTIAGMTTLRDEMALEAPSAANMMLKTLKAFLAWAVDKGLAGQNLAKSVKLIKTKVRKTTPWPEAIWQEAYANGPVDVSRLAFLGRKAGQRISDMLRMGEDNLHGDDLRFTIKKRRMEEHTVALQPDDAAVLRSWGGKRWLTKPDGKTHSDNTMREALYEWLGEDEDGSEVKPHGLRAMAVCDARLDGLAHQEIANLFGMSLEMVQSYSALIDRQIMGRATQTRRVNAKNSAKNEK